MMKAVVLVAAAILVSGLLCSAVPGSAGVTGAQTDITGPSGSGEFGTMVAALPSGNIVITDPSYDSGEVTNAGAVYLYNGASGALISVLTGSNNNDQVGSGGVTELANGNYVVLSPKWNSDGTADAGAATWGDGTTGVSGVVSSSNSLVGSTTSDQVGTSGVTALANGNYVVRSPYWDNGGTSNVGAVTWGDGTSGVSGVVSSSNSLVGATAEDQVGYGLVTALTNGNYVVCSPNWNNGSVAKAGAATWGNGTTGITGAVSASNSLVGTTANDRVCMYDVTALANGNYLVRSYQWNNGAVPDAGAVTWGDGTSGITGAVNASNSLVGSTADDRVGSDGVTALTNGNYVVLSPEWDNGGVDDAGAATWGSGTTGITGTVTLGNSLVGLAAGDMAGWDGRALTNGNYVVLSPYWHNGGTAGAGAATWGNGTTGVSGVVSPSNSLVGTTWYDQVGSSDEEGVTALSNGNYVVLSPYWDNGAIADAGAATWGNGTSGVSGVVGASNSLVGGTGNDLVSLGATALSNGNYVVHSPDWDDGAVADAGAATWGDGTTGIAGVVSVSNSLVGGAADDRVGDGGVTALSNGNYVVRSPDWHNGGVAYAGAVTWGNGAMGSADSVNASNSLVGHTAYDHIGSGGVTPLANGHYVVFSPEWDNGAVADAGAVTWGHGMIGVGATITAENSVRGTAENGGTRLVFDYDYDNDQLVVGRPAENIVTLFKPPCYGAFLPLVLKKVS
jgi:hypothetical protein